MGWEPRIVAFCCNWCAYAGADLAGAIKEQYATQARIIRVMCSGRVDPGMILKCYEKGADGVMVLGCHPGNCHYDSGNERAQERVEELKTILKMAGISPRRLMLEWVSASEGRRFASILNEFAKAVRSYGPLGGSLHEE